MTIPPSLYKCYKMVSTFPVRLVLKICSRVLPSKRSALLFSPKLHLKTTFLNNHCSKRGAGASVLILWVKQTATTKTCTTFLKAPRSELWLRDLGMIPSRSPRVRAIFRSVLHPVGHFLHKSCSTITQFKLWWVEVDQWNNLQVSASKVLPYSTVTILDVSTILAKLWICIPATKLKRTRKMRATSRSKHLADQKVKSKLQGFIMY